MNTTTVKHPDFFPALSTRKSNRTTTVFLISATLALSGLFAPGYAAELPAYPNASVAQSVSEARQNHPIITDRMKRVHGTVTSDRAQWLDGHLMRTVYLLPSGHTSAQGFEFYVHLLREQGVETLFECRSFSCGASNFWANDIFAIPTLYGQDKEQGYYIGKKQDSYYAVYSIRRGNGRIYTLVDIFTPSDHEGNADPISGLMIPLASPVDDTDLAPFVAQMRDNPTMKALLMLHGQMPNTLAEFDARRTEMDKLQHSLLQYLQGQGISSKRLRVNITFDSTDSAAPFWLQIVRLQ